MVSNSNFVKSDKTRKAARQEASDKQKQTFKGKTWKRTDKRAQPDLMGDS